MIGGLLLVDKPEGPSSHRIVGVARKALGTRDVGHAGTLDPAASGLLVLGVGEGLKLLRYLVLDDKRYAASVALGKTTVTLDAEGAVTEERPVPAELSLDAVRAAAAQFVGRIEQRVPDVSAVKQAGAALYKRVRRGEAVEAPVRSVVVHALDIEALEGTRVALSVACGKGFYVRALARDLALALGTVGHIASLRRLTSGEYDVRDALGFDMLRAAAEGDAAARERVRTALIPPARALTGALRATLSSEGLEHARHGRAVLASHVIAGWPEHEPCEPVLLLDEQARLVALARREGEALRIVRGIKAS